MHTLVFTFDHKIVVIDDSSKEIKLETALGDVKIGKNDKGEVEVRREKEKYWIRFGS